MEHDDGEEEHRIAMSTQAGIRLAKRQLRESVQQRLATVQGQNVSEQSAAIVARVLSMEVYKHARSVSVYMSMPRGEVMTRKIIKDAIATNKAVYVPALIRPGVRKKEYQGREELQKTFMDMVSLHSAADFNRCEENRDKWGIPTVSQESLVNRERVLVEGQRCSNDATLDLMIVPGVAFDLRCRRLGHGKGFYDRFLSEYKASRTKGPSWKKQMPRLIGVCLQEQLVPAHQECPVNDHDWPMDALVVGDGSVVMSDKTSLSTNQINQTQEALESAASL